MTKSKSKPAYNSPCTWARWLKRSGSFVVWDTETTGLEEDSAIVSIGIVDQDGKVLLDSLINPLVAIPWDATEIHGITDDMVKNAPTFAELFPQIRAALWGQRWAIYNSGYDVPRLQYECRRHNCLYPRPARHQEWRTISTYSYFDELQDVYCAMTKYADHWGDYSEYWGNNKWQSLSSAARQQGIKTPNAHHALGDAITTLNLINHLAISEDRIEDNR